MVPHSRQKRWFFRHVKKAFRKVSSGLKKAAEATGRWVKKASKKVYKAVTSGVGRTITKYIEMANSWVGKACCTVGLAAAPVGPVCCGISRATAVLTCGARTLQTVDSASKLDIGGSISDGKAAVKSCRQAITGIGRRRREADNSTAALMAKKPLEAGKRFMPGDVGRLRLMLCSSDELDRACSRYRTSLTRFRKFFRVARLPVLAILRQIKDPKIRAALKQDSCTRSTFRGLPLCHARQARRRYQAGGKPSPVETVHDHNPSTKPCRLVNPRRRAPTKLTCMRRMAFAGNRISRILLLLEGDVVRMFPKEFPAKSAEVILRSASGHATR